GRSRHTIDQYARHVRLLESWLAASRRSMDIRDVDHVAVAEFLCSPVVREKRGGGPRRAPSTKGLRSSLGGFVAPPLAPGYVSRTAAGLVRGARCSPAMGRVLTGDEVQRLERVLATAEGLEVERDRVMFGLLLGCGLRVGSLVSLHVEDVASGEILV